MIERGCTIVVFAISTLAFISSGCNSSPTAPSASASLPLVTESATMRVYYEAGDTVEVDRQEAFNAWAAGRLGVMAPQKVEYRKYRSREAMARFTGNGTTNGFAEPSLWRLHTIWPFDNHEIVHVYSEIVGRPSDFLNEGLAVSFQTDPAAGHFTVLFNGLPAHDACRAYLRAGTLPLPISRYVTSSGFRSIQDTTLSYRMAGSFVLHLTERFGLPAVLQAFATRNRDESLEAIRARLLSVFGLSLEQLESGWLAMLRE